MICFLRSVLATALACASLWAPDVAAGSAAPSTLIIQAAPRLAGVSFRVDRRTVSTDESGIARVEIFREGIHQLEALPLESSSVDRRLEFARWGDAVFSPVREIFVSGQTEIEAGFDVHYPLRLEFIDLDGGRIPAQRIDSVLLKNSLGDVYTIPGEGPEWVQSNHVIFRDIKLEAVEVVYTVQSVVVDGSNVVNRGQQRFTVAGAETQAVELLMYPARFQAKDALFGFPIGRGVLLEYPDGHRGYFPFGDEPSVYVDALARGTYRATAAGASGLAIPAVFVLSREQEVTALVISALDMIFAAALALSVLLGLLWFGRPAFRKSLSDRLRRAGSVLVRRFT